VYGTNNIIPVGKFFRLNLQTPVRIYFGPPLDLATYYLMPTTLETSQLITQEVVRGILTEQRKCLLDLSTSSEQKNRGKRD
jgi:hypothetical protein